MHLRPAGSNINVILRFALRQVQQIRARPVVFLPHSNLAANNPLPQLSRRSKHRSSDQRCSPAPAPPGRPRSRTMSAVELPRLPAPSSPPTEANTLSAIMLFYRNGENFQPVRANLLRQSGDVEEIGRS